MAIINRTLSVHKEHRLLSRLEAAGINDELAQRVIESKGNNLAIKVVNLIQIGGFESTDSQKRAREIMGKNFFGVEEAIKYFGINPTRRQLQILSKIQFSEKLLEKSKDSYVLVALFPFSILEIRERFKHKFFYVYEEAWYTTSLGSGIRWQLVRKIPVDNSISKNWQEQQTLIAHNEEVPTARIMVYTIIGHYLATGERLFNNNISVRTSSDSPTGLVRIDGFNSEGLYFMYDKDDYDSELVGVASAVRY